VPKNSTSPRIGIPENGEQPAHLLQRLPPRALDDPKRGGRFGGMCVQQMRPDTGPHGDHAHRISDDVVEFPSDAGPLIGRRSIGEFSARLLQRRCLGLRLFRAMSSKSTGNRPGSTSSSGHALMAYTTVSTAVSARRRRDGPIIDRR